MLIYMITNMINGKRYVGQTSQKAERRWHAHCHKTSGGKSLVKDAIQKYGKENFKFEVLLETACPMVLNYKEIQLISAYNCLVPNGYNLESGGTSKSQAISDETRKKMSLSHLGKKISEASLVKRRGRSPWNKGKSSWSKGLSLSKEHRQAISDTRRKQPVVCSNGVTYGSITEAAKALGTSTGKICAVLSGVRQHTLGHTFKRVG